MVFMCLKRFFCINPFDSVFKSIVNSKIFNLSFGFHFPTFKSFDSSFSAQLIILQGYALGDFTNDCLCARSHVMQKRSHLLFCITYLGRTLDVPWTYLGRTLNVLCSYLERIFPEPSP